MATRKAGKKSGKGSAGKKSAKKSAAKKSAAKRPAAKKSGAKKSASKQSSAKKSSAKKSAAKKSTAQKAGARKVSAAKKGGAKKAAAKKGAAAADIAAADAQPCLDFQLAGEIIRACAPAGFDINRPLCQFLAPNQLPFLQQCILDRVLARGCHIDRSQIPADCDSTLSDILVALVDNATRV